MTATAVLLTMGGCTSIASVPARSIPIATARQPLPRVADATPQPLPLTDGQRDWLLARLREDVLSGLLAAGRLLGQCEGEQTLILEGHAGNALAEGMPEAFRPWFEGFESLVLTETRGVIWMELRFEAWCRPRHVSAGVVRLHDVAVSLARDKVVTARLIVGKIEDPRAHGDPVPYDNVRKASDDAFLKATPSASYPGGHPFSSGSHRAPAGIEGLRGFTLIATVSGFWQDSVEILPVTRMFAYGGEKDIWISFLDAKEYETRPDPVPDARTDPSFDRGRLFFDYTNRTSQPSDELCFFNMSLNSRNASRRQTTPPGSSVPSAEQR